MNPSDVIAVLQWWSVLFVLGLGFVPLTFRLFDSFFDKGYIFSKLIGMLLTGYLMFVLGVLHLVPFTTVAIMSVFLVLAVGSFFILPAKWKTLFALKRFWFIFVCEEILFLCALFLWAFIHSYAPDIHGLEKYMDYGFVNSFLRSEYLPAKDMWFTPFAINYYYFGHLLTAMLTKLSGISSTITFNLMLSTIFAFCFTQTFSIGANLYTFLRTNERVSVLKRTLTGVLTACLVTLAGNLHIVYAFFKPYKTDNPVPFWQLQFAPFDFPNNSYWYPNATRFIDHTIHEFPIYSWVVADLHGHVLDIPFVLLILALFLSLIIAHTQPKLEDDQSDENIVNKTFQVHPLLLLFIGLLLACMYMTNAWDGAIYLLLAVLVLVYIHGLKIPFYKKRLGKEEDDGVEIIRKNEPKKRLWKPKEWQVIWGRDLLLSILMITAGFFIFTTPYNINFKPFVSGIGVLCMPDFLNSIGKIGPFLFEADHCQRSLWWQLLILYGFFYFFVVIFAIQILRSKRQTPTDVFVLLLIILATFLIIVPEFFYVKDIYPAHYRANTMFKMVFQAFILLSISTGYIIVKTFSEMQLRDGRPLNRIKELAFFITTLLIVSLVLTYPYLAVKSYYGDFKMYKGLDGLTYLKTLYPADYEGIAWLNDNVTGQPVILEAQGDSYTDYGRVSANTGLPTVLGWTVHEWLWRGSYSIPSPRIEQIKTLYETSNTQTASSLLKQYNVEYVFIGTMEYQKYPNLNEAKFQQLGKIVFQKDNTKIYKLN